MPAKLGYHLAVVRGWRPFSFLWGPLEALKGALRDPEHTPQALNSSKKASEGGKKKDRWPVTHGRTLGLGESRSMNLPPCAEWGGRGPRAHILASPGPHPPNRTLGAETPVAERLAPVSPSEDALHQERRLSREPPVVQVFRLKAQPQIHGPEGHHTGTHASVSVADAVTQVSEEEVRRAISLS